MGYEEGVVDTNVPGTLSQCLYLTNLFEQQMEFTESSDMQYQLSAAEVAPTAQEMKKMAEEDAEKEVLLRAVKNLL